MVLDKEVKKGAKKDRKAYIVDWHIKMLESPF